MSNSAPTITHPSSKSIVSEIEYLGFSLTVYRRSGTRKLWYRGTIDGRRVRKSTGFEDQNAAEQFVIDVIKELAERLLSKKDLRSGDVTLQQVWSRYEQDKLPTLDRRRDRVKLRGTVRRVMDVWGSDKLVRDIDRHDVETYTRHRVKNDGVKYSTVGYDVKNLCRVLNWAKDRKIDGRPIISENPVQRKWVPTGNEKPYRPLCRHPRFLKLLRVARHVASRDHRGYFLTMLVLARYTGRRFGSIRHLRYRDIMLTPEAIEDGIESLLDDEVMDGEAADSYLKGAPELWKHGAIRWDPRFDKESLETWIVPLHPAAAKALRNHLDRYPDSSNDFIFASRSAQVDGKPVSDMAAVKWIKEAEHLARDAGLKLRNRKYDGWHSLRRAWRTELPSYLDRKAIAKVGGWTWEGGVSQRIDPREDGVSETMDRVYLRVLPRKEYQVATSLPACRAGADTGPVTAESIEDLDPREAKRLLSDIIG